MRNAIAKRGTPHKFSAPDLRLTTLIRGSLEPGRVVPAFGTLLVELQVKRARLVDERTARNRQPCGFPGDAHRLEPVAPK